MRVPGCAIIESDETYRQKHLLGVSVEAAQRDSLGSQSETTAGVSERFCLIIGQCLSER